MKRQKTSLIIIQMKETASKFNAEGLIPIYLSHELFIILVVFISVLEVF